MARMRSAGGAVSFASAAARPAGRAIFSCNDFAFKRCSRCARLPSPTRSHSQALALSGRPPTEEEAANAAQFLTKRGDKQQEAFEDIVWAVLNTKEFLFNH